MTKKDERLCIHTYLILKAGLTPEPDVPVIVSYEVDRKLTIERVTKCITDNLPTATSDSRNFLEMNKQFVEDLCKQKDIGLELKKYLEILCPVCASELVKWPHKTKDSYLISLGEIKKFKIEAQFCTNCKLLSYYNLYGKGLVPINNKARIKLYFHSERVCSTPI